MDFDEIWHAYMVVDLAEAVMTSDSLLSYWSGDQKSVEPNELWLKRV